jgi:hypothetical protein
MREIVEREAEKNIKPTANPIHPPYVYINSLILLTRIGKPPPLVVRLP